MRPSRLSNITQRALDVLFPHQCAFCGKVTDSAPGFPGICRSCLPLVPFRMGQDVKLEPVREFPIYCTSWYQGCITSAIRRFKFSDSPDLALALSSLLRYLIRSQNLDCTAVAAVPLHAARLRERGYNQSGLLAARLSEWLGVEDWSDLVIRSIRTDRQSELSDRRQRQANVEGAFSIRQDTLPRSILRMPQTVLLIDDVLTTGATLAAAAKPLLESGLAVTGVTVSSEHRAKSRF